MNWSKTVHVSSRAPPTLAVRSSCLEHWRQPGGSVHTWDWWNTWHFVPFLGPELWILKTSRDELYSGYPGYPMNFPWEAAGFISSEATSFSWRSWTREKLLRCRWFIKRQPCRRDMVEIWISGRAGISWIFGRPMLTPNEHNSGMLTFVPQYVYFISGWQLFQDLIMTSMIFHDFPCSVWLENGGTCMYPMTVILFFREVSDLRSLTIRWILFRWGNPLLDFMVVFGCLWYIISHYIYCLVVWNMALIFPFSWEFHHPNWWIFFRGVETTNQDSKSHFLTVKSDDAEVDFFWRSWPTCFALNSNRIWICNFGWFSYNRFPMLFLCGFPYWQVN